MQLTRNRDEAKEMFQHAFYGYMKYAFPADEVKPMSCIAANPFGSYASGSHSSNDLTCHYHNRYTTTLVDTLDSLVVAIFVSTSCFVSLSHKVRSLECKMTLRAL